MANSTATMRRLYRAYRCNRNKDLAEITFLNRKPVRIIAQHEQYWRALEAALIAAGYPAKAQIVGSYNCRNVRDSVNASLHSYKLAIDIDPALNPRKRISNGRWWEWSKITRGQVAAGNAIVTNQGLQVFRSGTVFRAKDPMHWEINLSLGDLAAGVRQKTTYQTHSHEDAPRTTRDGSVVASPTIRLGAHGGAVEKLQAALNALGDPDPHLKVDGRFGTNTRTALRSYQRAHHLTVDGICGKNTWKQLDEV